MRTFGIAVTLTALALPGAIRAGEVPRYEPVPSWVTPAAPIDPAKIGDDAPIMLVLDDQQRLADGVVWDYKEVATRLASPQIVAQAGTVQLPWQPDKGDLIVHRMEIIRGAQHIDLLAGPRKFQVLRREQRLEQQAVDGQLTATMAVEGLQVGDVLRLVVSVTRRENAFAGQMQTVAAIPQAPLRVGFARTRLVWPSTAALKWKSYADGGKPVETSRAGEQELLFEGTLAKAADLPADAPVRFARLPLVEATTFAGWPQLSSVNAPLYATQGLIAPGSPLAVEVARIAAASTDPAARIAAALQLVQEQVRYLYSGMDGGNYVPQKPAQTWQLRYGDCKAKTLLLLALLHGLGIEAEPVLANLQLGDMVPERLPGAAAFNHVFVAARLGTDTLWLDGTARGARLADLHDVLPYGWVLPIRSAGAQLVALPRRAPARPVGTIALDYDQRAGVNFPTLVKVTMTVHGAAAELVRLVRTQGSTDQKDEMVRGIVTKAVGNDDVSVTDYAITQDTATGDAGITATAIWTGWKRRDGRYRMTLDKGVSNLAFDPDRSRPAWAGIPVATAAPETTLFRTRLALPTDGKGFALEGDRTIDAPLAGTRIARTVEEGAGVVTVEETVAATGAEVAVADIGATRAAVTRARGRLLEAVAPGQVPPRWQAAEAGRRDGRFKPLLDAYAKAIAAHPEDADAYVRRANFLIVILDYKGALADMDKAVALQPSVANYYSRAALLVSTGNPDKALADWQAARKLDASDTATLSAMASWQAWHGQGEAALAAVQERVDAGGSARSSMLSLQATVLSGMGRGDEAIATLNRAIADKPGDPDLLNGRCWIKAQLRVQLDTALKDCTKAIELSDDPATVLDSRALVYERLGRREEALADLASALEDEPNQAESLFLQGVIRSQAKDTRGAGDIAAAQLIRPGIAADYARFGVTP